MFAENVPDNEDILKRLNSVSYNQYQEALKNWESRISEHKKLYRFKQDPKLYLSNIETKLLGEQNQHLC